MAGSTNSAREGPVEGLSLVRADRNEIGGSAVLLRASRRCLWAVVCVVLECYLLVILVESNEIGGTPKPENTQDGGKSTHATEQVP